MGNLTANEKQYVLIVPKKVIQIVSAKTHLIAQTAGNHCAYSKECVEWIKQKEMTRMTYEQNTSFGEMKKIVEQTMRNNTTNRTVSCTNCAGVSYAQAVARKLTSVAVQTDLSFTSDSIVTFTVTNSKIRNYMSTSAQTEDCGAVGGHAKNQCK